MSKRILMFVGALFALTLVFVMFGDRIALRRVRAIPRTPDAENSRANEATITQSRIPAQSSAIDWRSIDDSTARTLFVYLETHIDPRRGYPASQSLLRTLLSGERPLDLDWLLLAKAFPAAACDFYSKIARGEHVEGVDPQPRNTRIRALRILELLTIQGSVKPIDIVSLAARDSDIEISAAAYRILAHIYDPALIPLFSEGAARGIPEACTSLADYYYNDQARAALESLRDSQLQKENEHFRETLARSMALVELLQSADSLSVLTDALTGRNWESLQDRGLKLLDVLEHILRTQRSELLTVMRSQLEVSAWEAKVTESASQIQDLSSLGIGPILSCYVLLGGELTERQRAAVQKFYLLGDPKSQLNSRHPHSETLQQLWGALK